MNLIWLGLGIIVVSVIVFLFSLSEEWGGLGVTAFIFGFLSAIVLIIGLIAIPFERASKTSFIRGVEAIRVQVSQSDNRMVDAALRLKVAEINSELEQGKYWANNPWFSVYWPSEFRNCKPIELPRAK